MISNTDSKRELLRHTVATLAYRGRKAVQKAPDGFEKFTIGDKTRTPAEILSHIGDLLDWALALAKGQPAWQNSLPRSWKQEVGRFFKALQKFDSFLASEEPLGCLPEKLFQGPIADSFTHVGQIAMLRRLAGSPVRGENYFKADIQAGRVGPDHAIARKEFD
jgi:hypothetical protein